MTNAFRIPVVSVTSAGGGQQPCRVLEGEPRVEGRATPFALKLFLWARVSPYRRKHGNLIGQWPAEFQGANELWWL